MAKNKKGIVFFCGNCGYESAKWMGQCPSCKEWNTFVEEKVSSAKTSSLKDKKEAQALFDASLKMKPSEKDELYIVKENADYQAILKIKKFRKNYCNCL